MTSKRDGCGSKAGGQIFLAHQLRTQLCGPSEARVEEHKIRLVLGFLSPPTVRYLSFAVAPSPPAISFIRRVEMAEGKPKIQSGVWRTIKPFVNGGASGMLATCVIQPIDMVKVRIQLGQGSAVQVTKNMLANEGFGSFYKGLSAGLLRQATYTTARLGSFRVLTNKAVEANDGKPLPLLQKAAIGLTAGAIGASVGSPADLALIRMQADATLPAAQRRNYKNAFHALYRIIADEGVLALWKGAGPTVVRAMSLNMGMLASYDQSIELFRDSLGFGEVSTVLGASAVSGFFASACSLPFDYVKTQIQKMQPDATGKYPYTGSLDCVMKTLKSGGPFKFYTGFPVYCVRIAPHVMVKLYDVDILESNSEGRTGSGLIEIRIIGNAGFRMTGLTVRIWFWTRNDLPKPGSVRAWARSVTRDGALPDVVAMVQGEVGTKLVRLLYFVGAGSISLLPLHLRLIFICTKGINLWRDYERKAAATNRAETAPQTPAKMVNGPDAAASNS
ncbi:Mitochondrial 2-oxoglutarate malate carrier [Musa troglodytarum]|uniref:Mitochondrial 2-oxoglutarate malate carrier n=1 Tax=Musa troglodytarum TaxID=320322 RepID=A0A9E7L2T4_9LILI|nr:Mitochondrial 2-oxoglutarate malate carrier [Musa troglodytarum]